MFSKATSITALLDERAARVPQRIAFRWVSDRGDLDGQLTFGSLRAHALAVAEDLLAAGAKRRDRALLAFPPGIEFLVGWFGCLYANVIAVPTMPPRRSGSADFSASIIANCSPRFVLTSKRYATEIRSDIFRHFERSGIKPLIVDLATPPNGDECGASRSACADDVAFLQYTSGSTSAPKGVVVTNANLIENLEMIQLAFGNSERSNYVSWVPLYHDMGLILNALQSFYVGAGCTLMSPVSFQQRPLVWLRIIDKFKAEVAGGPNFAFDLCVARFDAKQMQGVDLSCWQVAFNGSEPVRADTLQRFAKTFAPYGFRPAALYPCYGMAEATLLISGGRRGGGTNTRGVSKSALRGSRIAPPLNDDDEQLIVGCGRAVPHTIIAIADPVTRQRLPPDSIGEIWVHGAHVAQGYWQNATETAELFAATLFGEPGTLWLRTGDLGVLTETGELFITARIKDVIIIRGRNHYPQDIEHTVQGTDLALRAGYGAAFTIEDAAGTEQLVIIQEVERTHRSRDDLRELGAAVREAIAEGHDLSARIVVLVAPGSVPKTTSGKIQRRLARKLWQDGALEIICQL